MKVQAMSLAGFLVAAGKSVSILAVLVLAHELYAESPVYSLTSVANGMQVKTPAGKVVFEFKTKVPADLPSPSAAYFDPVNTPSGERVSNAAPDDHPWHRGIFLAPIDSEFRTPVELPKDAPANHLVGAFSVKRADFWAWGLYAPREGRVIRNHDVRLIAADGKHAQIEIHNDWLIDEKKMLDEMDEVYVAEREGVYVIDFICRLAPVVDYVLSQSAFGEFVFQAQKYGDWHYSTNTGIVADRPGPHYSLPDSDWPSEPWYDYSIRLKSDGKVVGVAIVDHPLNPPTRWHNTLWMLNPCITSFGPLTIHPKNPLILRYRVVVHDGETPTKVIQSLSTEWRATKGNPFVKDSAIAGK